MELRVLNASEVRAALPMAAAIEAMKEAFRQLSLGLADAPRRTRIDFPDLGAASLFMPAYSPQGGGLAVKVVSIFPRNAARHLPTLHALVVVLDATTGQPTALLEGSSLTALRTGAASGAATDLLARAEARVGAVFGAGSQARTQLEAICTVRQLERVWVVGRDRARAEAFAREMAGQGPIPADVRVADGPSQAVRLADIICTATTSSTPVFPGEDLQPGAHVNAVGGFTPQMQEVDSVTVRRSRVFVDSRSAALAEAGDLLEPIRQRVVPPEWVVGELGEIVAGRAPGRRSPEEITLFKSVGVSVQDAVAAARALEGARASDLGTVLRM